MIRPPRFFYVGELSEGGTCLDRMLALKDIGIEIFPFNIDLYLKSGPRISRSIAHRFNFGPHIYQLNRALLSFVKNNPGITHIWIDKGKWLWPETLLSLKRRTSAQLIHYTPDPAILFHKSRYFNKCIPVYDVLFTTKRFEIPLYHQAGAQKLHFTYPAFEKKRFYPRIPSEDDRRNFSSDICIIGHSEKHYAASLRAVSGTGAKIQVWGPGWVRYSWLHPWASKYVSGNGVWGEQYPVALNCGKIILGLLSKYIPETITTRSFEIPACGAFMLAERTEDHLQAFQEGKEAEYFASRAELIDKAKYYLNHQDERNRIGDAGRQRCLRSGYDNHERLKKMLAAVGIKSK